MSMNTIYKYRLSVQDRQEICIPSGASLLSVQMQNGTPCLWALVNTGNPLEEVVIRMYGTGHEVTNPGTLEFIGTFQYVEYGLVYHVFKEIQDN